LTSDVSAAAAAADGVVVADSNGDGSDAAAAADSDDDDDEDTIPEITLDDISEQFQIPKHVYEQHQLKKQQEEPS